jgi:hypothetical protein
MPGSFYDDLAYIGKIILITLIVLSIAIIYNGKLMEGIILLSFSIQLILIWLLDKKYEFPRHFLLDFTTKPPQRMGNYTKIILLSIFFIVGLLFIFRAIAIIQHSISNYGIIKSDFNFDIILAGTIGGICFILLVLLILLNFKQTKKKINFKITN